MRTPIPLGVPVEMMSPGSSASCRDTCAICSSGEKII
jgi:hypothetical protein